MHSQHDVGYCCCSPDHLGPRPDVKWRLELVRYLLADAEQQGCLPQLLAKGNNKQATALVSACWFGEAPMCCELARRYSYEAMMVPTERGACLAGGLAGCMLHAATVLQ
jgi:hypothetical protein